MTTIVNPGVYRGLCIPAASLCRREIVRFLRYPSRVVGAIGTPLVFWLVIGSGLGASFRVPGRAAEMNYLEYFYPGSLLLILLFTSVFTMMSVIEDKKEGFLLSALVAPIPRSALVLGKVFGGAVLAAAQGMLFLAAAPLAGVPLEPAGFLLVIPTLFLISVALTGFGFLFAWRLESTQGFHSVVNLLLIPLWMLSGAPFPMGGASPWVRVAMTVNPLTYANAALRHSLYSGPGAGSGIPSFEVALGVTGLFTAVVLAGAFYLASRPLQGNLG